MRITNKWMLLEMADRSLVSARTVRLKNFEFTVGLQNNGIWLFNHVIVDRCPPERSDAFLYVSPKDIRVVNMMDIFDDNYQIAAEVHTAWAMMNGELLNFVRGGRYYESMARVPTICG